MLYLYEAERCGIDYIACDVGANKEFFNRKNLIEVGNSDQMSSRIIQILNEEKIRLIYNSKAKYYLQVLNEFDNDNLSYVLLNYLIPDDNPDLDVISLNDLYLIEKILKKTNLNLSIYYTNQIIWNKFVSNIGFIQFIICWLKFPQQTIL